MRASLTAVVVVIAMPFVVGCSQMGQSTSPTAPSSASSVTPSSPRSFSPSNTIAQVAPGASYDASGSWHVIAIISSMSGEVLLTDEFDDTLTADSDGNLHSVTEVEGSQVTLLRKGKGLGSRDQLRNVDFRA